jgi:hypothetical protein
MPETREMPAEQLFGMALKSERSGDLTRADTFYGILQAQNVFGQAAANYAVQLAESGQFAAGAAALEGALKRSPDDPIITLHLAQALLRLGDFERGWPLHERRAIHVNRRVTGKPKLSFPEWSGQPVRSLLVVLEQGLGDQIMFARYAAQLQAEGVDVTLLCDPLLMRLFEPLGVSLLPAAGTQDIRKAEAWTMLMSLPFHRRAALGTISGAPYLPSAAGGAGIGVKTEGNPLHVNDAKRSLPAEFAAQLHALPGAIDLAPERTGARDLADTARLINELGLVITVDTSVAHLAAAMGKPTWILLPYFADWRWMLDRADSPWYQSARLFRQPSPGDWRSVISEITATLAAQERWP